MEILTIEDELLTLISMGKPDNEKLANNIVCLTKSGKRKTVTPQEIKGFFGSYSFPPPLVKEKKEL